MLSVYSLRWVIGGHSTTKEFKATSIARAIALAQDNIYFALQTEGYDDVSIRHFILGVAFEVSYPNGQLIGVYA